MRSFIFSLAMLTSLACYTQAKPNNQTQSRPLEVFTSDAIGFDTHSFWFDTGKEVVVFDAQFTEGLAKQLIAQIQRKTKSPIKYLVVTHPNPDKFNGVRPFQALGAKVVASEETAKAIPGVHSYKKYYFVQIAKIFTEETYPPEAKIDLTFRGDFSLPLEGNTKVLLHELKHRGVSSTQTVAYLSQNRALIVGDLVHHKAHAWLEGGIIEGKPTPELASWKLALEELLSYQGAIVYGGRGEAAPVEEAVSEEVAYLETLNAIVTQYVTGLGDKKAELSGPKAGEHYKNISRLAQEALPGYSLSYMIEYGVYGLVNQVAAQ
jgi:glyoxylase-like metal-dependent hydrolase (beta-lactamase superfamily II)